MPYQQSEKPVTEPAPYSVGSMVIGILSLISPLSLLLGIIGLVLANKGLRIYRKNPDLYTSPEMLRVGKITSIIGICKDVFFIATVITIFALFGALIIGAVSGGSVDAGTIAEEVALCL